MKIAFRQSLRCHFPDTVRLGRAYIRRFLPQADTSRAKHVDGTVNSRRDCRFLTQGGPGRALPSVSTTCVRTGWFSPVMIYAGSSCPWNQSTWPRNGSVASISETPSGEEVPDSHSHWR